MKKNLTELVFILDRSGSMGGLEQDTIGGFNAMLTRQKEQEGEANVTTILFDHEVQLLYDRFPLKAVAPLTEKDYYVRGCTALLDSDLCSNSFSCRSLSAGRKRGMKQTPACVLCQSTVHGRVLFCCGLFTPSEGGKT